MRKDLLVNSFLLLFFLITLPFAVLVVSKVADTRKQAAALPANIIVDPAVSLGEVKKPFLAIAQGGEKDTALTDSKTQSVLRNLSSKYVRIDHLYGSLDGVEVVTRVNDDGSLEYNWLEIDKRVRAILSSGALPFFSLSYMPQAISSGDIISMPKVNRYWQRLVKDTIEHYSGRSGFNLSKVYYEVWNEPDLFGGFTFNNGENGKSYLTLYKYAALGVKEATNTNQFYFGGPATTEPRREFIVNFLNFASANNLRVDFVSWHRYHKKISQFRDDLDNVDTWVGLFPKYANLPRIISEWGSEPGVSPWHDSFFDGAHYVAAIRQFMERTELVFFFEVKDGAKDDGAEIPGRWGIVSHYGKIKPKYYPMELAAKISGERILLNGEGSNVTGIATREGDIVSVLLSNYDPGYLNSENVPITILNLQPASYSVSITTMSSQRPSGINLNKTENITSGSFFISIPMLPNTVLSLKLTPISKITVFEKGRFGYEDDQAVIINSVSPIVSYPLTGNNLSEGTIDFWFKPSWSGLDLQPATFFEIPLAGTNTFAAYKKVVNDESVIDFGVFYQSDDPQGLQTISAPVRNITSETWQHLIFSWKTGPGGFLRMYLDGKLLAEGVVDTTIDHVGTILVGSRENTKNNYLEGVVDEFRILKSPRLISGFTILDKSQEINSDTFLLRHFDGSLD